LAKRFRKTKSFKNEEAGRLPASFLRRNEEKKSPFSYESWILCHFQTGFDTVKAIENCTARRDLLRLARFDP